MTLLLAVAVSFLVVDGSNRPIAGAEVCHTAKRISFPKTGADGRIKIDTDVPRVVVRMQGYWSEVVPLRAGKSEFRVVMRKPVSAPTCRLAREPHVGWPAQLRHGYGPNNGGFQPLNSTVWDAAEYTETNLELNGRPAIDAKSTSADGRRSRYIGNLSETITYDDVDDATAHQFDKLIERACQTRVTAQVTGKVVFVSPANVARNSVRVPDTGAYEGYTSASLLVFRGFEFRSVLAKPSEGLRIEKCSQFHRRPSRPAPELGRTATGCNSPWLEASLPTGRDGAFSDGSAKRPSTRNQGSGSSETARRHSRRRVSDGAGAVKPVALFLLALPLLAQPPVNVQVLNSHGHSMDGVTVQPIADDPSWARIGANGRGANWSHGSPPNDQIAASVEYEEHRYVLKQFRFIDARGKLADGTIWRYLGQLGESADYETKDPAAAKELDKILDKVCLAGPRR